LIILDGFFSDDQREPQAQGLPRSLFSATDSGDNDREEVEEYIKSIKKRAHESSRIGGSSSSTQDRRSELWTLPVPVRFFAVVLMIGKLKTFYRQEWRQSSQKAC
jgi:hypothetical protein